MARGCENKTSLPFVIVASGPSLTPEQVNYCRGKAKIIVINDNYKLAPWAEYLYACDDQWWSWHEDDKDLLAFQGVKYTQDKGWTADKLAHFKNKHHVECIRSEPNAGLSTEKGVIFQGSNGGYQAINLAYHLGAKKIILIGYDMKVAADGKAHWFGDHPNKVKSGYASWIQFFSHLAKDAQELGLEIINCTADTALHCFPRQKLEDTL